MQFEVGPWHGSKKGSTRGKICLVRFGVCFLWNKLCGMVYVCSCGVRKARNAKYCRLHGLWWYSHAWRFAKLSRRAALRIRWLAVSVKTIWKHRKTSDDIWTRLYKTSSQPKLQGEKWVNFDTIPAGQQGSELSAQCRLGPIKRWLLSNKNCISLMHKGSQRLLRSTLDWRSLAEGSRIKHIRAKASLFSG